MAGIKVLDFGLAKAMDPPAGSSPNVSQSPTITSPAMTQAGMILGTAAYMAPEQARGKAVDERADIWAFGAVLFEMLTGKRAFPGEDLTDTLAAVVKLEPNWDALGPNVTARVRQVLRMCLQKDPKQRIGDIHDVRLALDGAFDAAETVPPVTRPRTPWVEAAAMLAVLAVVGWMRPRSSSEADLPDLTLAIAPPSATGIRSIVEFSSEPIVSPDGVSVAYRDRTGGFRIRRLDTLDAESLPFPGGFSSFGQWSRDGRTFLTDSNGELWQMRLPGGAVERTVGAGGPVLGASRSRDGDLLFAVVKTSVGLFRLAASGGEPQPVALPGLPQGSYFWPEFISGTDDFIVTFEVPGSLESEIYLATLRDGQPADPVLLMRNRTAPHHTVARGGRLLFVRDSVLYAQALNLTTRRLEGDPEVVANNVGSAPAQKSAKFSVSTTGVIAWRAGVEVSARLVTFDRQGRRVGTSGDPGLMYVVRLSPDERRLLVAGPDGQRLLEPDRSGELVVSRLRSFMTTL